MDIVRLSLGLNDELIAECKALKFKLEMKEKEEITSIPKILVKPKKLRESPSPVKAKVKTLDELVSDKVT